MDPAHIGQRTACTCRKKGHEKEIPNHRAIPPFSNKNVKGLRKSDIELQPFIVTILKFDINNIHVQMARPHGIVEGAHSFSLRSWVQITLPIQEKPLFIYINKHLALYV